MTCAFVGAGVVFSDAASRNVDLSSYAGADVSAAIGGRTNGASRDSDRTTPIGAVVSGAAIPAVAGRLWSTTDLDLRLAPREHARTRGEVAGLSSLKVTGIRRHGYAQVVVRKRAFWVTADYLVRNKPTDPAHMALVDRPCAGTSGVESGITPAAVRVYRAVCNNFPQVTHYGGYDAHGEHSSGRALDIMTSDVTLGTAIADFLRAHAAELNLYDVIWRQHIFTQERAGEGWRSMSSRGSATANHMDHVHVSVY